MDAHSAFVNTALAVIGLASLGIVLARILALVSAYGETRDLNRKHTVIAEYDSPKRLTPAELGYVIDARFGTNELLATIAQLYTKELVRLTKTDSDDFTITATDNKAVVDDSEASVLGYLRSLPDGKVSWKRLSSVVSDIAGAQAGCEDATMQSLEGKGLLYRGVLTAALFRKRFATFVLATAGTICVSAPMVLSGYYAVRNTGLDDGFLGIDRGVSLLLLLPVVLLTWGGLFLYVNMLTYIYSQRAGVPLGATDELRTLWPDVAGFRLFLQTTEYVRLQHDRNPRDSAMAYCLALGLDPGFIRSLPDS